MKRNDYLEKELEKCRNREPISANPDVLQAYLETMENGNLFLTIHNFNGCNRNVLNIIPTLERAGIDVFAVSDSSTAVMQNLFTLATHAELVSMVAVSAPWHNPHDEEEWEHIPAALFKL